MGDRRSNRGREKERLLRKLHEKEREEERQREKKNEASERAVDDQRDFKFLLLNMYLVGVCLDTFRSIRACTCIIYTYLHGYVALQSVS